MSSVWAGRSPRRCERRVSSARSVSRWAKYVRAESGRASRQLATALRAGVPIPGLGLSSIND